MKHQEGLRISLIDQSRLDSAGVLRGGSHCANAYGIPAESIHLFLLIAAAGAEGLPKSRVPKELRTELLAHLLPLELQELVTWERDLRGRLAYLVLTWKGEDALAAAKPQPRRAPAALARRGTLA